MFGMFKAGLVPVNTNYRYGDDELVYLWDNADVGRRRLPRHLRRHHRAHPRPQVPVGPELAVGRRRQRPVPGLGGALRGGRGRRPTAGSQAPWGRSGDDLYLLYTGGTTGMPKGVMWRQDDIFVSLDAPVAPSAPRAARPRARCASKVTKPGPAGVPAAPLMHGTGAFNAMNILQVGRLHRHAGRPLLRRRRAARHHRARAGQVARRSSATPSPSRSCAPSTPSPTGGTSRACG